MTNIREFIYKVNEKNSVAIARDFDFDEVEEREINTKFWPIIILSDVDLNSIKVKITKLKEAFVEEYKVFDVDIFKRENLDYLEHEIKIYLTCIEKGKYHVWDYKKGKCFYHLKLESEIDTPKHQTLLVTEKDEIQLEIYFKALLFLINDFFGKNNLTTKNTPNSSNQVLQQEKGNTFIELEKSKKIIGYYVHGDKSVIQMLLNLESNVFSELIKAFDKELNRNLLIRETNESKVELLRFYIFEFFDISGFFRNKDKLLFNTGTYKKELKRELDEFEEYVVKSWEYFDLLFNEIQLCCVKYSIDFFKICDELSFSLDFIDSGVTLAMNKHCAKDFKEHLLINNEVKKDEALSLSLSQTKNQVLQQENKIHLNDLEFKQFKGLTKEQLLGEKNNLINGGVSIEDVFNYFEILITSRNRRGEFYLTEKQLLIFIKTTFIDLKPVLQHFNGRPNFKKDIRSLFFRFYEQCSVHEYNATGKKKKYSNLMFNAFSGFDAVKDFKEWNKINTNLIGKKITNRPKN
jgi:uncharacterized ubiquitin-like protein YukD